MNLRILFARVLIKLGHFVQELAVTVMRSNDLIEFSRVSYSKAKEVKAWGAKQWLESGLTPEEADLEKEFPIKNGKLFLLGVGGGREAIFFAKKGIDVTAVDFIPDMVEEARKNIELYGVHARVLVQEISSLTLPDACYDFVWISMGLYSAVPTKKKRVKMLKNLWKSLKPEALMFCQFHWDPQKGLSSKAEFAKKLFAILTLGNFWYERGDMLWGNSEFLHAFTSEDKLRSEFETGGFKVISIHFNEKTRRAGAILQKPE
ncbi:MAG: class I SAM-dependent methyltransferase [Thermodesulfovibrionales bacterium]|nr:class I SAM-dependent methyltransferase [Thermodesulfovibrionales bacterium]